MIQILLITTGLFALFGLFLIGKSLYWRFSSVGVEAEIVGFQKKKSKGRLLPIVEFEDQDDNPVKAAILSMDNIAYMISGADKHHLIPVRYSDKNPKLVKFTGYLNVSVGAVLQTPFIVALSLFSEDAIIQGRFTMLLMLAAILGIGWLALRMLRFYY